MPNIALPESIEKYMTTEELLSDYSVLTDEFPYEEPSDGDATRRTHVVNPPANTHIWQPGMPMQTVVDIARLN